MVQDTTLNPFFKDAGKVAKEALNYSGDASKIAHAFKQLSIKEKIVDLGTSTTIPTKY